MQTEIEAKFLDIDPNLLREKLEEIGAKLVYPERLMKRNNFDFEDRRLEKVGGWVRARDEGDKITLSYKQLNDRTLHGTKEIVLEVDDFENACNFLKAVGLRVKAYQETKRENWVLDDVEITIDTWPWIPTFLEIESKSEKKLEHFASRLGLNWTLALHGSVEIAYQKYFAVSDEELYNCESISFRPVPEWLEKRRIKK